MLSDFSNIFTLQFLALFKPLTMMSIAKLLSKGNSFGARAICLSTGRSYHALTQKDKVKRNHCVVSSVVRWKTKAVIFDLGGVVIRSPFPLTVQYEKERGIPAGTIWKAIDEYGADGAWPKLETGELDSAEFAEHFSTECSATAGKSVQLHDFLDYLEKGMGEPIPQVVSAIKALRAEGIKTSLLTNNWKHPDGKTLIPVDRDIFDVIVESAVAGVNKPNPVIYHRCLDELGVKAEDAVFLDDIGSNIKAAKAIGINCIKVDDITKALLDLESILQVSLAEPVIGTRAVRKGLEISETILIKYIQNTLKVTSNTPPIIRQFTHGQSNPTYYIKYGDLKLVLRKKPPGKLLPSAHSVEREYEVMSALGKAGVPVPRLLAFCDDCSILATPFYLMEYMDGNVYKNPLLPGMEPERRKRIYHSAVDVLCKIHSIDIQEAGLSGFGKQGNYVERQLNTWSRQYKASETHTIASMDRLIDWLPQHLPEGGNMTLVHGDFRLDNIIFDPETDMVKGVLDWELSTLGDPFSDVSYMCVSHFLPKKTQILPGMAGIDIEKLGIPSMKELVNLYCEKMNVATVENMDFYMAFTFFRIAAILQGVYKRSKQGQASSPSAGAAGLLAENMADIGWKFACKEGFRLFNSMNRTLLEGKPR